MDWSSSKMKTHSRSIKDINAPKLILPLVDYQFILLTYTIYSHWGERRALTFYFQTFVSQYCYTCLCLVSPTTRCFLFNIMSISTFVTFWSLSYHPKLPHCKDGLGIVGNVLLCCFWEKLMKTSIPAINQSLSVIVFWVFSTEFCGFIKRMKPNNRLLALLTQRVPQWPAFCRLLLKRLGCIFKGKVQTIEVKCQGVQVL